MSPYLEHSKSVNIEDDLFSFLIQDHELDELRDEALLAESLVQDRHRLRHVSFRVPLALVHRVLDHLRPLVVPVEALVQEDRLFPFLLRGGWLVAVESDPEIVIAIARLDVVDLHGTLEDVSERSLEVDARWLLQPTEGGDAFLGYLNNENRHVPLVRLIAMLPFAVRHCRGRESRRRFECTMKVSENVSARVTR